MNLKMIYSTQSKCGYSAFCKESEHPRVFWVSSGSLVLPPPLGDSEGQVHLNSSESVTCPAEALKWRKPDSLEQQKTR